MELRSSMCLCRFVVVLYACVFLSSGDIRDSLNNWEILTMSGIQRQPVKRDTTDAQPAEQMIKFNAFGRHFALFLRKNHSILAPGFKTFVFAADGSSSEVQLDLSLYKGSVEGDVDSFVSAHFDDQQVLSANIQTSEETYAIEPARNLIPYSSNETMIMYKRSDLKWNNRSLCGYVTDNENSLVKNECAREKKLLSRPRKTGCTSSKNTCQLYLVGDPGFMITMANNNVKEATELMVKVINDCDNIYRKTDFTGCGTNFGFEVKVVKLFTTLTEGYPYTDTEKPYSEVKYLELFELDKQLASVCLGVLFTQRTFKDSSGMFFLGLASTGALCTGSTKARNQNSLFVSTSVGGKKALYLETVDTTAHELGHAWGTSHDPSDNPECAPKPADGGKYIMYASATRRNKNSILFSPCSRISIGKVLVKMSEKCFQERKSNLCGNNVVETGEQCDGGSNENSNCCDSECKFKPNAVCFDSNDGCCDKNCQIIKDTSYVCRTPSSEECVGQTTCDGVSSKCPAALVPKPDDTPCSDNGKCRKGKCLLLCPQNNYEPCACDTLSEGCKWCCLKNDGKCSPLLINGTFVLLPAGMACIGGTCDKNGTCKKGGIDKVKREGTFLDLSSSPTFVTFMRNNFTITIIILSLLIWIPASCYICYLDRRDKKKMKRRARSNKTSRKH